MKKRMPGRRQTCIYIFLLISLLLANCTAEKSPPSTITPVIRETNEQQKTIITWWTEPILGSNRKAFESHIVDSFNAAHTNIALEVNYIADLDRVTRTAVQGGEGPDIIQSPGPAFVLGYIDAEHIIPLDDYADRYRWFDLIYPWAIEVGTVKETLYSLPLTYETMVLIYNATLFDQMEWKVPNSQAEMESIAQQAINAGIIPFAHGNASWKAANEWYVTIFMNNYAGSEAVYQALTGERRWDDPLFVESVTLLDEYMTRGWFSGSLENYYTLQYSDLWGALGDGTAAMQMVGTWGFLHAKTYFDKTGNEWSWAPLPMLRQDVNADYPLGIGSSLSINANTPNPDAAATVLNWLYSDPKRIAGLVSEIGGGEYVVPVKIDVQDFPANTDQRVVRALTEFSEAFGKGDYGYTSWSFWPPATEQFLISGIEQVWNNELTPEEYCTKMQEQFELDLAAGKAPPIPPRE